MWHVRWLVRQPGVSSGNDSTLGDDVGISHAAAADCRVSDVGEGMSPSDAGNGALGVVKGGKLVGAVTASLSSSSSAPPPTACRYEARKQVLELLLGSLPASVDSRYA